MLLHDVQADIRIYLPAAVYCVAILLLLQRCCVLPLFVTVCRMAKIVTVIHCIWFQFVFFLYIRTRCVFNEPLGSTVALSASIFFFFFFPIPFIFFALLFSLLVVPQIRGHVAGSSPPLPSTVRALHFFRDKISALSSLVDSRRIVLTHDRRSQQLIL